MKKFLTLMVAALTLCTLVIGCGGSGEESSDRLQQIKDAGKIVLATSPDYAPYEFEDVTKSGDDKYVGMDIELARYIAAELGVELEIEAQDFDSVLSSVANGKVDIGISGLNPDEERKKTMDFSDIYYLGGQAVLIRKADAEKYTTIDSLKGQKVGAQNGSTQQGIVEEQLPESTYEPFVKVPDAVLALKSGKVEAVVVEGPVGDSYAKQYDDIVVSPIEVKEETGGVAVAFKKGEDEAFIAEINRIIKKAQDEGKIDEWMVEANELANSISE